MTTINNTYKKCEGCICYILDDSEKFIDDTIFHNYICSLHYKYIRNKNNIKDKEQYEKTGRDYFIDVVEYNIDKQKIRDATVCFLVSYINMFFDN
jgi:hypothetical protein